MMPSNPKAFEERLRGVIDAWSTLRPTKSFAGMTLTEFKTRVQPAFDQRDRIVQLNAELVAAQTQRDQADVGANELALLVVNAVKGDPLEGEDGELYAAMGYVRKSERKSGLTRRATTNPPSPVTQPS